MIRFASLAPILVALAFPLAATAQTVVSGPVSGTWTLAGSPYVVQSSGAVVTAPAGLIIEAGVVVQFESGAHLAAIGPL